MKLETAEQVWNLEAIAHDYAGFLVIAHPIHGHDRIFIRDICELEIARENCEDNSINIIKEIWVRL